MLRLRLVPIKYKLDTRKISPCVHVLQRTQNLPFRRCYFSGDGKEIKLRTCKAIGLLIKPSVCWRSHCRCRRVLRKVPSYFPQPYPLRFGLFISPVVVIYLTMSTNELRKIEDLWTEWPLCLGKRKRFSCLAGGRSLIKKRTSMQWKGDKTCEFAFDSYLLFSYTAFCAVPQLTKRWKILIAKQIHTPKATKQFYFALFDRSHFLFSVVCQTFTNNYIIASSLFPYRNKRA